MTLESEGSFYWKTFSGEISVWGSQVDRPAQSDDQRRRLRNETFRTEHSNRRRTIRHQYHPLVHHVSVVDWKSTLQCFDTVGWGSGVTSPRKKTIWPRPGDVLGPKNFSFFPAGKVPLTRGGAAGFNVGYKTGFASGASEKNCTLHFSKCGGTSIQIGLSVFSDTINLATGVD